MCRAGPTFEGPRPPGQPTATIPEPVRMIWIARLGWFWETTGRDVRPTLRARNPRREVGRASLPARGRRGKG